MNDWFPKEIQKVEYHDDRLVIRCVHAFDSLEGFLGDDVWLWEVTKPQRSKISMIRALAGKYLEHAEVKKVRGKPTLLLSLPELADPVTITGTGIQQKIEDYTASDLISIVESLRQQLNQANLALYTQRVNIAEAEAFIDATIHRTKARFAFEQSRASAKADGLRREIEDLETILRKIRCSTNSFGESERSV